MIELLKRLAAAEPKLCRIDSDASGTFYFINLDSPTGWVGVASEGGLEISARMYIEHALRQAIKRRGWEFNLYCYRGGTVFDIDLWATPVKHINDKKYTGLEKATAAEALLVAYIAAAKSEER